MGDGSDDGWTQVGRRGARRRSPPVQSPGPRPATVTVDEVRAEYGKLEERWVDSDAHRHIRESFDRYCGHSRPAIDRAICLGNASFDPGQTTVDDSYRAHFQTKAFLYLVDLLSA
jgi:hypothetical protein